jgi:hypothetical protein
VRWPWRRQDDEPDPQMQDATRRRQEQEDLWPEVHHVTAGLRRLRHRNQFGAMIEQALREGR